MSSSRKVNPKSRRGKKRAPAAAALPPAEQPVAPPEYLRSVALSPIGPAPNLRPAHLPDEGIEHAALRETYYHDAEHAYSFRLRDLVTLAAGPSGDANWDCTLDDPEHFGECTIATEALDAVADELQVIADLLDRHGCRTLGDPVPRLIARLAKRARAAAELARRLANVGPPEIVKPGRHEQQEEAPAIESAGAA